MNINWGMIGIIALNTFIWYSIFTKGFFITSLWVIVITCILALIFKLRENRI
jgi:hypothetical protein